MELFVVTCNGYREGYGSELYLVGVFTSEEEVKAAKSNPNLQYDVIKVPLGKVFPMEKTEYCNNYSNENYIGGYFE